MEYSLCASLSFSRKRYLSICMLVKPFLHIRKYITAPAQCTRHTFIQVLYALRTICIYAMATLYVCMYVCQQETKVIEIANGPAQCVLIALMGGK